MCLDGLHTVGVYTIYEVWCLLGGISISHPAGASYLPHNMLWQYKIIPDCTEHFQFTGIISLVNVWCLLKIVFPPQLQFSLATLAKEGILEVGEECI